MAASNNKGALPEGFVSPFKRVAQEDRHDDALASVAIFTGKSLADVRKLAEQFGLPKTGPYWSVIDNDMIAKLLMNLGNLVGGNYKEVTSNDAYWVVGLLVIMIWGANVRLRPVLWIQVQAARVVLVYLFLRIDYMKLQGQGYNVKQLGLADPITFPFYLFSRAKVFKQGNGPAIVWCVLAVLTVLVFLLS